MPSRKRKPQPITQPANQSAEARIDKLLELVDAVARVDTKMEGFCKDTAEELKELKKEIHEGITAHSGMNAKIDQLEKELIKAQNERIEWKMEFDKWKWRLGVIAPVVSIIVTATITYILHAVFGIF
jgi:flagellar biosynthesis chaperone FliJ